MAKRESKKRQAKEAERRTESHAPKPTPRPATYCTRCSAPLATAADIDTHNRLAHLCGK